MSKSYRDKIYIRVHLIFLKIRISQLAFGWSCGYVPNAQK